MRQVSSSLILSALFLTLIIFVSGVIVGSMIDKENLMQLEQRIISISDRTNSNTAIFLLENSSAYCPYLENEAEQMEKDVEQLGYQLSYLEDTKNSVDNAMKNRYFNLQLNSYLLSNRVRKACGQNFTTILYFYSNKNCFLECREQGQNLLSLKGEAGVWVKIYSFDNEIGSASAKVLADAYNVSKYPSVVVGNKKYVGVQTKERLLEAVASAQKE